MNMAKYCKDKGMSLEQYNNFSANITATAAAIIQQIKTMYKTDTGVYYPIYEILPTIPGKTDTTMQGFIIQALKAQGVEFFDNNTLWRY